jgi:hypothetical protein
MKRNCLYCGKVIHVRDSYQEPVCKEPSARCKRLREEAKAKFAEHQKKEALSTVRTAARSEQSERYGPDLRNDDGDVVAVEDLSSPDVHVEVSEIEEQEETESKVRVEGAVCDISTANEVEEIADTEKAEMEAASLELDKEQTNDNSEDEAEEEEIVEESALPVLPEPKKPEPGDIGPDKKKKSRFSTQAFPVIPSADPLAPYGRDDDGKPIRPMRSDRDIHAALLESHTTSYVPCKHRNDPAHCAICKPLAERHAPLAEHPVPLAPRNDSDTLSIRGKTPHDRRIVELKEQRKRLLADWEVRRQKLTKERYDLHEKWARDSSKLNEKAMLEAEWKLSQEAEKATQAIAAIYVQIEKLSSVHLREVLGISQTTIVEWLDRDGILHDSWRETRFKTRTVNREIKPAEKPAETPREEDLASPEQIQNLKRCSRNARKDYPDWSGKQIRQYRRETKKKIREVLARLKEQAHKPKPPVPIVPEPQYETVVENIPESEYEVTCFGEDIFDPETVAGYRDTIARGQQNHKFDEFENDVIRRACQVGVFQPPKEIVRRFPALAIRVQTSGGRGSDTDNSFDHAQQDKSILKGAGGLTVIGAGWSCNPRTGRMMPRAFGDFNHTRRVGSSGGNGSGPDDGTFGDSFGDVDMPADSEGDES